MSFVDRIDGLQRERRAIGFPLAVLYKYLDDGGGYLSALVTYYGFVSLFPLLLLASTVLGLVLNGDPHLQMQVLNSALEEFPVVGTSLKTGTISGGASGLVIGGLGALYGGLGIANALQNAMNTAWAVPKNSRPNPFKARGRSLLLLVTVGGAVLATTVLTALTKQLGTFSTIGVLAATVVVNAFVFTAGFRIAAAKDLSVRDVLPGALAATVVWQLLQTFGATYVTHVVKNASATNSVFALVLGLIAFLYIASVAVVFCVELNVVLKEHLWPRALLTPMTDSVDLTEGDRKVYANAAKAQRNKGFEQIDVVFHKRPAKSTKKPDDIEKR